MSPTIQTDRAEEVRVAAGGSRRSPSHISDCEWAALLLVISLILGLAFAHRGDGASRWGLKEIHASTVATKGGPDR